MSAPFKADHVGSLLRPVRIHQARKDFEAGNISKDELFKIETEEIEKVVDKQIEVGLKAVTDGEFRRRFWHTDFMEHVGGFEGYIPEEGYSFNGMKTEAYNIRNIGKISFDKNHPHVKEFILFKEIVGDRAVPKQTIPSPNQFFNYGVRNKEIYPDIEEYTDDIIAAYQDAILAFYDVGCRYLQLDDVYIARLNTEEEPYQESGYNREQLIDLALRVVNGALEVKPEDMVITTHLCRGNYRSTWAFEGSYAKIAPVLFAKENVDGFFLEYDDDRSGDFEPLKEIPDGGPAVVLGLLTSKSGDLEDKEVIKARIEEATNYVPKEQIRLSPQCGFSSTHHGNVLTEEEQWEKLRYVIALADELL
ncbi:5-methyltetrahydropteroyltriglutamate--homocysteine S-methyltransferase [Jeotgalicoccus sp. ATCC 8456]|uniref:5-methyltetrahydropteroyltriglutamate-- homocysteine S-methyltransferase n=1 Tax=Jeotgalicoccus sp. ATCC 8456 TaxID=946435 RepID=UPI0018E64027|nr:5-methyltetrahydropteroyltriglutamate--homocysteine S-methyltransferase [Jeotgalicoccus sp. ATCC 8456]QQD84232.1 5-methyltetrahydropteroyltriglutamate--homocysteine S-methyltransferase [Jeotgalicoccus sp. ATCC 8456]